MGLGLVDKPHLRRFKNKLDQQLNNKFVKKTDKATTNSLGVVKPDGTTITVDANGTISGSSSYELPTASTSTLGGVKIDGTTVTIDNNGVISATASGGSSVTWTQTQADGIKIAEIDVDGTSQDVYVPTVEANPQGTATGTLTTLQVGDDIYEVSGGGGSSTLADLTDTDITTPSDNQDLVYDNTSSKWKNKTTKIFITQSDYDALSYAEKHNGCLYYITDAGHGSEKFTPIGLGECYSTEERMIGCWTDGKPVYQKTIIFDNITSGRVDNMPHGIANIDKIVHHQWEFSGNNDLASVIVGHESTDQNWWANIFVVSRTDISYRIGAGWGMHTLVFTLQYTKTTDTAGSGSWTPSGVPAVHYSTSEQIIGTWVDGKTLYQKTWVETVPNSTGFASFTTGAITDISEVIETKYSIRGIGEQGETPWYSGASVYFDSMSSTGFSFYFTGTYNAGKSLVFTARYTKTS